MKRSWWKWKAGMLTVIAAVAFLATESPAAGQFVAKPEQLRVLTGGTYYVWGSSTKYLTWTSGKVLPYASEYTHKDDGTKLPVSGVKIYAGECADLRRLTDAPAGLSDGSGWTRGDKVAGGTVAQGTLIAMFKWDPNRNRWVYDNTKHSCLFKGYNSNGSLKVWSQRWPLDFRCIREHDITGTSGGGVNDRNAYYVVKRP